MCVCERGESRVNKEAARGRQGGGKGAARGRQWGASVGRAARLTAHARDAGTGSCSRSPSHVGLSVLQRTGIIIFFCEKLGRTCRGMREGDVGGECGRSCLLRRTRAATVCKGHSGAKAG